MAKNKTAVAVQDSPSEDKLPSLVELGLSPEEMLADANLGKQHVSQEDLSIPFLRILMTNSPEVEKRGESYVEGAEPGMIFNTVTKELYDGEAGVIVVPAEYLRRATQWKLRENGGGLVKDWGTDMSVLDRTKRDEKNRDMLPDGTQITVAGTHYCMLVHPETGTCEPVVVGMSSTQRKKSNRWNTLVSLYQAQHPTIPGKTFNPARFFCAYRLTTVPESNDSGSWYGWEIAHETETLRLKNGIDIYKAAKAFGEMAAKGLVKTAEPEPEPEGGNTIDGKGQLDDDIPF